MANSIENKIPVNHSSSFVMEDDPSYWQNGIFYLYQKTGGSGWYITEERPMSKTEFMEVEYGVQHTGGSWGGNINPD